LAYKQKFYYLQKFDLLQFWACVITARMSAKRTVECGKTERRPYDRIVTKRFSSVHRFVNGVIGFDRELSSLSTSLSVRQRSLSKKRWNRIVAVLVAYSVGFRIFLVGFWPPKDVSVSVVMSYGFSAPILMEIR